MVDEAIEISTHKPTSVVVFQRSQCQAEVNGKSPKDYDWTDLTEKVIRQGKNKVPCEEVKSTDELYLLYTSGTTGKPKGIVRESGGNAVHLAFTMQFIFNITPQETISTASDIGWVFPSVGKVDIRSSDILISSTHLYSMVPHPSCTKVNLLAHPMQASSGVS